MANSDALPDVQIFAQGGVGDMKPDSCAASAASPEISNLKLGTC